MSLSETTADTPAPGPLPPPSSPVGASPWARPVAPPAPPELRQGAAPSRIMPPTAEPPRQSGADSPPPDTLPVAATVASPWLVSLALHLSLCILLGLVFIARQAEIPVLLEAALVDAVGEQTLEDDLSFALEPNSTDEQTVVIDEAQPVDDPFATPPPLELAPEGRDAQNPLEAPQIGLALRGRDEGTKARLLAAYGGNGQSEAAVEAGLRWLVRQQRGDGSWSLTGPYTDHGATENTASATAMALMALQGAGHTHQGDKHRKAVAQGIAYLRSLQDDDGNFFQQGGHNHAFYTQGQATIAVCELYGMTGDLDLKEPASRAIWYCCRNQDEAGGWRYSPGTGSDLSVTGWVLMGLQSGRMAGLDVPYDVLARVGAYLDLVALENGSRYVYQPGFPAKRSMTAEGLLCRQYLGWGQRDPRLIRGAEYLTAAENLPSYRERDVYYWYYATQVLHHLEGPHWEQWNPTMRDLLVKHQDRSGREAGSWDPLSPVADQWGHQAGRLYVTCLSLYILEVYYRHLPLYSAGALAE